MNVRKTALQIFRLLGISLLLNHLIYTYSRKKNQLNLNITSTSFELMQFCVLLMHCFARDEQRNPTWIVE